MISNIFYGCFVILSAAWAFCYYVLGANGFIHILLGIAALCIVLSMTERKHTIEAE